MSLRHFKDSWQELWFVTSGGNLLCFKIPVRRVMGSKSNCLLVSYSICSLAKRFLLFAYLPASDYHSVILNDLNCLCESGACNGNNPPQNVHTPCFMLDFPANPLITLRTNVSQKTTSQMRTLRIQWHTWIKADCVHCQTSAAVENIKDKFNCGLCQRESIC